MSALDDNWLTEFLEGVETFTSESSTHQNSGKLTRDQRRFNWALKYGVNARKYANERALIIPKKTPLDTTYGRIRGIYQLSVLKQQAGRCFTVEAKNLVGAIASAVHILSADSNIQRVIFVIPRVSPDLISYISSSGMPLYLGSTAPSVTPGASRVAFWLPTWSPDYYPCSRFGCAKPNMRTAHSVCIHCHVAVYCNEHCRGLDEGRHRTGECEYLTNICTTVHLRRLHKYFPSSSYGSVTFQSPSV